MATSKKPLAPTTTSPATMGQEMAYPAHSSGQSPNVKSVPRGGAKSGAPVGTKSQPGRTNIQTDDNRVYQSPERLGAKYAPQMPMSAPTAPEAAMLQRNVRIIPRAVGNRDFWSKRSYGQVQQ